LAKAGFMVASISPSRSFMDKTRAAHRRYSYGFGPRLNSIIHAIDDWNPDLLVCADDQSVKELHRLHRLGTTSLPSQHSKDLINLIERSLGDPSGFEFATRKSKLLSLAISLGLRCPATTFISAQELETQIKSATYPILVKADGSWGGKFVRIVDTAQAARTAIREFQLPSNWPSTLRQLLVRFVAPSILERNSRDPSAICLQDFVQGCPANRAVVCWKGRVLAGVSVRVHKTVYTFGPASVVEVIDSADMTEMTNRLADHLKLSGLVGFDFVLDSESKAWLIEMNPRVTPVSYLAHAGEDLSAALLSGLTGIHTRPEPSATGKLVALFPQELQRSSRSEFLSTASDDVPWEDPELVLALLNSVMKMGPIKRLGMKRLNRQNLIIQRMQQKQIV
jgi:ATP-grasp domain